MRRVVLKYPIFKFKAGVFILLSALFLVPFSAVFANNAEPNDPNYQDQQYLQQTNVPEAWRITKGSKRVVVALIDSGVEFSHPDLQENIWTNPLEQSDGIDNDGNGLIDDIHGWDFVENKSNPGPDFNAIKNDLGFHHGTIVAGMIGAIGNNGTAGVGINWHVSIMPLRALNGVGDTGTGEPISVINAINYAIDHHVDVINMSFIGKSASPDLVQAIRRAYEADITVVAAAGNEGNGNLIDGDLDESPRYPVCIDGPQGEPWWVIGVAAVDGVNHKARFSGYGDNCVDISAPGVGIPSTLVLHPSEPGFNKIFGGSFSGTSLATPQVTGAIALLKSLKPNLTPKEIYEILTSTADSIDNENPLYANKLGAGLLDVKAAVEKVRAMVDDSFLWLGSSQTSKVMQIDSAGVIQKQFTFNYGKSIGVSLGRARDISTGKHLIITGSSNTSSQIRIFDEEGLPQGKGFFAYPKNYQGGVQIAVGDIDGDGEDEVVVAPSRRYTPEIRVYSLSGTLKNKFFAYAQGARLGIGLALADFDGDGLLDIITGVKEGGSAHVRMFNGSGEPINKGFFAAAQAYRGGINIAAADTNGDGRVEILTVPLNTTNPNVRLFNADGVLLRAASLQYEKDSQFAVGVFGTAGSADFSVVVARTGKHPIIQSFSTNLESIEAFTTHLSAKDFKGMPTVTCSKF